VNSPGTGPGADAIEADRLAEAERFVEQEDGAANRLRGPLSIALTAALAGTSVFHLYAAVDIVSAPWLRGLHVALMLGLLFLTLPMAARFRDRVMPWDWLLAGLTVACIAWFLRDWDAAADRAVEPDTWDVVAGGLLMLLVLEAVRRTSGWVLPRSPGGAHGDDDGRHLRRTDRRVRDPHRPVHRVRRDPPGIRRR